MAEDIFKWMKGVISIVFVVSFFEMLIPENGLKKFTKAVLGIFIIACLVDPLINLSKRLPGISHTREGLAEAEAVYASSTSQVVERQLELSLEEIEGVDWADVRVGWVINSGPSRADILLGIKNDEERDKIVDITRNISAAFLRISYDRVEVSIN